MEVCYISLTPVQFEKFLNQEVKLKSKKYQEVEQIIIKENEKYMVKNADTLLSLGSCFSCHEEPKSPEPRCFDNREHAGVLYY